MIIRINYILPDGGFSILCRPLFYDIRTRIGELSCVSRETDVTADPGVPRETITRSDPRGKPPLPSTGGGAEFLRFATYVPSIVR